MLVTPQDIQANWIILDIGQYERYQAYHLPGARFVDYGDLIGPDPIAVGACPSLEALTELCHRLGISPYDPIVLYDDRQGTAAGRLFWVLELCGFTNLHYLHGGLDAWIAAEYPLSDASPIYKPSSAPISFAPLPLVTYPEALAAITDPNTVFWDTRSDGEYDGTRHTALKNGHIPGAVHYEWSRTLEEGSYLKPFLLLKAELTACGITAEKQIITYCHSHHRSALCYMIGRILGFQNIRGYAGSWSEWGNTENSPVETTTC